MKVAITGVSIGSAIVGEKIQELTIDELANSLGTSVGAWIGCGDYGQFLMGLAFESGREALTSPIPSRVTGGIKGGISNILSSYIVQMKTFIKKQFNTK